MGSPPPPPPDPILLGPNETPTVQKIHDRIIPYLISHFSHLRSSIPRPSIAALPAPAHASSDPSITTGLDSNINSSSSHSDVPYDGAQLCEQIDWLQRDLSYIGEELKNIEDGVGRLVRALVEHCDATDASNGGNAAFQLNPIQIKLSRVTRIISRLKLQIPLSHRILSASSDAHRYEQAFDEIIAESTLDYMPKPQVVGDSLWSSAYRDFCSAYQSLDLQLKLCLLCFAVFPEQAVIKKRVMSYWWIGEGLLDPALKEQRATAFDVLALKGFIHPINKKRRLGAKSYRMHPIVRLMVINMAKEANFFDFDSKWYPTANFSGSLRACLVKSEQGSLQNAQKNKPDIDFARLHTLFNVNEEFLDLKLDWFTKMKNISVLSLGRWEGTPDHHIEVRGTEFFRGLTEMKHLKFLSLQGISRISELPDSLGQLYSLKILDLRSCHNLESLPDEISKLKELTNLDVSGCYLLDSLPKGIGSLSKLEVLMGFVINDSKRGKCCTLNELRKLGKLRKLGIITTRASFPEMSELDVLGGFFTLKKLTITWGSNPLRGIRKSATNRIVDRLKKYQYDSLPRHLEKLDLQCYPRTSLPAWFAPGKLEKLRALYIRGGNLHRLGSGSDGDGDHKWKVKILRLKYLNEFRMNWIELRDSFPKLVCLEKINCPRLTLFPCDETGVWLNEERDEATLFKKKDGAGIAG